MFNMFGAPSPASLALQDLRDAQRDLLVAESCAEHYYHTVLCLRERIERLEQHVTLGSTLPAPRRPDRLPNLKVPR